MKQRVGFTIFEVIIALSLMCLLFVGGLTLFLASIQLSMKTHGSVAATSDAMVAALRVSDDTRHALWVALPSDSSTYFTAPTGTTSGSFQTTSLGVTMNTAVEIVFPASSSVTLATGTSSTASIPLVDRSSAATGGILWVYRADPTGEANSAGTCLWIRGTEQGATVNQAILKTIDPTASDAVQFQRPTSVSPVSILPYQLAVKIVSAYYSPISGTQKSDATIGAQTSSLNPRSVMMRDHEAGLDHQGYSSTVTTTPGSPWLSN